MRIIFECPPLRELLASFTSTRRKRSCDGKVVHYSPVLATKAAYSMEAKRPGEVFEVYPCRHCGFYHVGHSSQWKPQKLIQFGRLRATSEESSKVQLSEIIGQFTPPAKP